MLWVSVFGAALAWLQSGSNNLEDQPDIKLPVEDEWTRWEEEIHDWKDS